MATVLTHALVGAAIAQVAPAPAHRGRLLACAALLAVLPDIDVLGFGFGIAYDHALGHRGFTHSLTFAALAGLLAGTLGSRGALLRSGEGWVLALVLGLATASHGVLDAFSDAGLGVGFWIPFDAHRSFAPWRPLATSPIGVDAFFGGPALAILANEVLWVWLPVGACLVGARFWRRRAWYSP
ncbi:MAG: metal-dependent hydrolase [Deltaproteobacteria bacterium]|nr:metal-dependent hydrolase [Deltaproteobacteria bacterium]MBW2359399.1 metal-dependent hydrolase [Deltaproteobacteria bacterium]